EGQDVASDREAPALAVHDDHAHVAVLLCPGDLLGQQAEEVPRHCVELVRPVDREPRHGGLDDRSQHAGNLTDAPRPSTPPGRAAYLRRYAIVRLNPASSPGPASLMLIAILMRDRPWGSEAAWKIAFDPGDR